MTYRLPVGDYSTVEGSVVPLIHIDRLTIEKNMGGHILSATRQDGLLSPSTTETLTTAIFTLCCLVFDLPRGGHLGR